MANKEELIHFLDRKVFDPILHAQTDRYDGSAQDDLKYVQDKTKSEKDRFHNYSSADEVVRMFKDDLNSDKAKTVNHKLQRLGLPRLVDVRDEFEKLA
jgi:hypothetical protein